MERESSKEYSFFCGQGKLLVAKSSFEEFNNVSFKAEHKMSCLKFIQGSKVFEDFSATFIFYFFKREFMYV